MLCDTKHQCDLFEFDLRICADNTLPKTSAVYLFTSSMTPTLWWLIFCRNHRCRVKCHFTSPILVSKYSLTFHELSIFGKHILTHIFRVKSLYYSPLTAILSW